MCKAALPRRVSSSEATVILVLNIFFPGVGTMVASVMGRSCRCDTFLVGVLQLLTVPVFLVGWVWSVWWGIAACGRVGHKREVDDAREGSTKHSTRQSKHSEGRSSRNGKHGKQGSEHAHSGHSGHSGHGDGHAGHGEGRAQEEVQQGFPQAYPEPTYPDAAYQQQPYHQPYPKDYPPTQPPV